MKKQIDHQVEANLKGGLSDQAKRSKKSEATLLEEYIAVGLARESGQLIEQSSLPAIRAAVREEFNAYMDQLYERLSHDLQQSARKNDDRLAALIVKAARSAGIAQRMLFSLASKLVNYDFALKVWESQNPHTDQAIDLFRYRVFYLVALPRSHANPTRPPDNAASLRTCASTAHHANPKPRSRSKCVGHEATCTAGSLFAPIKRIA